MSTGLSPGCVGTELVVGGGGDTWALVGDAWALVVTAERDSGFGDVGACVLVFGVCEAVAKEVDGFDPCRSGSEG